VVCPHCSFSIAGTPGTCPQCHLPIEVRGASQISAAVAPPPTVHFIEQRHMWLLVAGWSGVVTGVVLLGIRGAVLLGILGIAAAVVTIWVTKSGSRWTNLTPGERVAVMPGIVTGILLFVVLYVVVVVVIAALRDS
jgi:hypothetical protein